MTDVAFSGAPPRPQLLAALRLRIASLAPGLRPIAEGLLGADARIDFVALEPPGRVVLILVGQEGEDLELIGRALAQRAWVEPRLSDWIQLGPNLGLMPNSGVRAILLCPTFRPETLAAASALPADALTLMQFRCLTNASGLEILLEPIAPAHSPQTLPARPGPQALPAFRTGLTDDDLDLSDEERSDLG